jgi:hypothetical protein
MTNPIAPHEHHRRGHRCRVFRLPGECDLRQVPGAVGAVGQTFGLVHGDVAEIVGAVAHCGRPLIETGDADGRGTHVHAAAALSQIERRADDGDVGMLHDVCVPRRDAIDVFIAKGGGGGHRPKVARREIWPTRTGTIPPPAQLPEPHTAHHRNPRESLKPVSP